MRSVTTKGWIVMKKNREERCRLATLASMCLISRPGFVYKGKELWLEWVAYNMKTGDPIPGSRKVRIIENSHFDFNQPWGRNQGAALVYLANWVRSGKMLLTVEDWEHWCSNPVYLGNKKFLQAIKRYIYGEIQPLADVVLPTYCGCNELIEDIEQLEAHVERGCWRQE